jgi:uracil-DNA glycosylase family 4
MAVLYKIRPENRRHDPLSGARTPGGSDKAGPPPHPPSDWDRLVAEIDACQRCPLHSTRTRTAVFRGALTPTLVFVGEAPGAEEDRAGLPFVGRAGRILDLAIARLALPSESVGILNIIKCRPPKNRFDEAAARACRPFLLRQIDLLSPRWLVSLGGSALRALDPSAPPILRAAGVPRSALHRPLFPLIHPAATLRSARYARRWADDIDRLGAWLHGAP